jgi:signal transduction histidine kinase
VPGGDPDAKVTMLALRNKPSLSRLRSEYERQIRQAARREERERLARDLHDAVKQQLFVIQTAGATVEARFESDPAGARAAVGQLRAAAREAMTEMEGMLGQLEAAPIGNPGLVAFVRQQCEALGFRTGAAVKFELGDLPDEAALDPGAREAIARVAQEALSNVARHARATAVTVSLGLAGNRLLLTVEDDGQGFETGDRPQGMGMRNIAARASETGGTLDVVSAKGRGTVLRFSVPTSEAAPPRAYARRANIWAGVLIAAAVASSRELGRPWTTAMALIAGIAVARYCVAVYAVVRRRGA